MRIMTEIIRLNRCLGAIAITTVTVVSPDCIPQHSVESSSWNYVYGYQAGMEAERADNFRFFNGAMKYFNVDDLINAEKRYMEEKSDVPLIEPPGEL